MLFVEWEMTELRRLRWIAFTEPVGGTGTFF